MLVEGSPLFGSFVDKLLIDRESLSNNGRIAFVHTLTNGVSGVAVATPVPEPATAVMLVLGTGLLLFVRRTRRA